MLILCLILSFSSAVFGFLGSVFHSKQIPQKPCEDYTNTELFRVPARCLKHFQYEEEIIEVSINGEVQQYQKNASQPRELQEVQ